MITRMLYGRPAWVGALTMAALVALLLMGEVVWGGGCEAITHR